MLNAENFFEKMDEQGEIITLVEGTSRGQPYFAYVAMKPSSFIAYKLAEKEGSVKLAEYGKIIEHGEGSPSKELKKKIEEEYAGSHEFEEKLQEMINKSGE